MKIMSGRVGLFKAATEIYQKTGISLLKYSGKSFAPLEEAFGGEIGAFYFVPFIATICNLSYADATWYFFTGLVILGAIAALSVFLIQAKTFYGKLLATFGVCILSSLAWLVGDVYVAYFFIVTLFPWVLYLLEKSYYRALLAYLFFLGVAAAFSDFVRSYSSLPLIVGLGILFFLKKDKGAKSYLFPVLFCAGFFIFNWHINTVLQYRNNFLRKQGVVAFTFDTKHTFWHSVYMGFGFITNDKKLHFSDPCSARKVRTVDPAVGYLTDEYEAILRREVFALLIKSPHYVMRVLFAKLGVLLYFLLLFANIGLVAAYCCPKPLYVELSYWSMIAVSALPGILTVPITTYLLGFITVSALYGIHSIIYILNKSSRAKKG